MLNYHINQMVPLINEQLGIRVSKHKVLRLIQQSVLFEAPKLGWPQQCICVDCGNFLAGIIVMRQIGELYNIDALASLKFEDVLNILTKLGQQCCLNYLDPENYVMLLEYTFRLQSQGRHCTYHTKHDAKCTYCNWTDHGCFEKYIRPLLQSKNVDIQTKLRYERNGYIVEHERRYIYFDKKLSFSLCYPVLTAQISDANNNCKE